jgi:hypothetical protein
MRQRLQKNVSESIIKLTCEGDNLSLELDKNLQPIRRYVYGVGKDDFEGYVDFSEITGVISGNLDSYFQESRILCTLRRSYGKKMDIYINSYFCY